MGRLGNSLFQIASVSGIAAKLGTTACFPLWTYGRYFKTKLPRLHKNKPQLYEPCFHYDDSWFEDDKDYVGWLQSEKYFESKEKVKELFEFDNTFKALVDSKHRTKFEKETICVSIRRGDFVGNENYELIPIKYYIGALLQLNWKECNILFFSDDISYCRKHFECLDNAFFIDSDAIEQLYLMNKCDYHVISNSTFSWWGAYLSDSKRVIRPAYNFSESYLKKYDDKDYYCSDWEVFDHKKYFIPLDTTFLIPVQYDHEDRIFNFSLCVRYLRENFDCKILTAENNGDKFKCDLRFEFPKFHRTKMLNIMARASETDTIVLYDADVLTPPMQLYLSLEKVKSGVDVVYPYDGRFARVPRRFFPELNLYLDIGVLNDKLEGTKDHDLKSVGGAIMFNKEAFFRGGGENEDFVSYAPEDKFRWELFNMFFRVERVKGILYHVDHFIGVDSYIYHDDYQRNLEIYERFKNMTKDEIRVYRSIS